MGPLPLPSKTTLLHTGETLLVGAAGGTAFTLVGFPAGLIAGSLLAVAGAALAGRPMRVPPPLSRAISVLVGISLGAVVTPETLKGIAAYPLTISLLLISTACMVLATTSYLRLVHGWDAQSALFGASPGALAQVMMLATEYGADLRAIAIVQVVRVVVLTIGIPSGLAFFGLAAHGMALPPTGAIASWWELALLVVASTVAAMLMRRFRLPGGLLFGSMIASAVLHGGGFVDAVLPWWAAAAAVVGIGAVTGSRFANTDPRTLLQFLGAALGSFAVAIAVATCFVLLLTTLLNIRVADAVVAFAPGAQDTMMVMALALHLDPIFIGAHHLSRFLLVSLSLPLLANRLRGTRVRSTGERAPPRPVNED